MFMKFSAFLISVYFDLLQERNRSIIILLTKSIHKDVKHRNVSSHVRDEDPFLSAYSVKRKASDRAVNSPDCH